MYIYFKILFSNTKIFIQITKYKNIRLYTHTYMHVCIIEPLKVGGPMSLLVAHEHDQP